MRRDKEIDGSCHVRRKGVPKRCEHSFTQWLDGVLICSKCGTEAIR